MMRSSRVMRVSASLMRGRPSGHWPSKLSLAAATARRERSARSSSDQLRIIPVSSGVAHQVRAASPATSTRRNLAERAIAPTSITSGDGWRPKDGVLYVRGMSLADLGLIGNCQLAAHVRRDGAIVWCCMPRFDSAPIFGALLDDDGGQFTIGPATPGLGVQRYLANTNVLETRFEAPEGAFRVLDFAPRFVQCDRSFRPTKLVRIVEPLAGTPRIRVSCDPVLGWSKARPQREAGSHHISYRGFPAELRLTTDAPLSYLDGEPFALTERKHFVLLLGRAGRGSRWSRCASASSRETVALLAEVGEALRHAVDLPGGSDPLGAGAEAPLLRGHRRDRRGDDDVDPGVGRARGARGTTATAGCATPTTRSARSACSATSRSASSSSTSC